VECVGEALGERMFGGEHALGGRVRKIQPSSRILTSALCRLESGAGSFFLTQPSCRRVRPSFINFEESARSLGPVRESFRPGWPLEAEVWEGERASGPSIPPCGAGVAMSCCWVELTRLDGVVRRTVATTSSTERSPVEIEVGVAPVNRRFPLTFGI